MSQRITKWEEERKILWARDSDVRRLRWFDFLFFVKYRWCEDKSFWTQELMFSFTNRTLSERCTPESLRPSHTFLFLCHTDSPSSSFLLYQIEKRCFIWTGTLKAFPLSLSSPLPPTPPLNFTLHALPQDPWKYKERGANTRRLTASWKTHKWTTCGRVPISNMPWIVHQQI